MDSSDLKSGLHMPPTTEEPLINLHFPQKLWRIVNECKSGAISWSVDGKAVVIDYASFQSSYLYQQQEIFKTSNMSSFIRQLNLYGFRKASPHEKVTAQYSSSARGTPTSGGIHVFRNESFVRGRPDLLRRVARKAGPPRAKRARKTASGYQSSGSSTSSLPDEARTQCQGRRLPSRDRQRVTRRVSKQQPSPSSRSSTKSESDSTNAGPSHLPPNNHASSNIEGVPWCDDNSSSDTSSLSDYDWEHITAMAKVLSEKSLLDELTNSDMTYWPADETVQDMNAGALQPVCTISGASSTECGSSPMPSSSSSMLALLDSNNSPSMVLTHEAGGDEPDDIPWLEEPLMLDSVFGNIDESLSDNLYSILTEEAENSAIDDQPPATTDGAGESATSFFTSSDLNMDFLHSVLYGEDRGSENDELNLPSVQETLAPHHSAVERTPDA